MELTWQGRFCVRMRSREATVVADPFPADVGPTGRGLTGDIVTFSHDEPLPPGALRQMRKAAAPSGEEVLVPASLERAFVLNSPGEFEVRQVLMTGVRTELGERGGGDGRNGARNIAFVYELDGVHVCHMGDIGTLLTEEELGEIGSVELLCLPIGGALTATAASELVAQVDPKLVVPLVVDADPAASKQALDRFLHEMGASNLVPQPRFSLTISTVPEETTVILLEQRGRS
jgi:L-ascorbate metabolism protein UlaG (beta-lactamase superfamily)